MHQPFGTVTGFDQTVVVEDRVGSAAREVKYTIDRYGLERLLYADAVGAAVRAKDRVAAEVGRALDLLPERSVDTILHHLDQAGELADRLNGLLLARRARQATLAAAGLVPVGLAVRALLAADVSRFDAATEERLQRDAVLAALRDGGASAVVVPGGPDKRAAVAVRASDVDRVAATLAERLGRAWYVTESGSAARRPRRLTRRRIERLCRTAGGVRLFRLVAGGAGQPIAGVEVGVDIDVWRDTTPAGDERAESMAGTAAPRVESDTRFVAMRRQAWANRLPAEAWSAPAGTADAGLRVSVLPHLLEVTEPIDVVYTWVDGADPEWNAARVAALGSPQQVSLPTAATHAARFRSHDELRFSLRSLEMFAPWVRTVHIVTAGQVPYWLDTDHPRVNLVDHQEIFPTGDVLPVFNSHAIESCLHRIPGLAERYLYLNDDVFFGRPVRPELFFHGNGLAKFFPSTALVDHGPREAHDDPVTSAAKNNRELIARTFGRTTTTIFQHTPHPQLRSVLEQMEAAHPELFAHVAASKFRHPDDVSVASSLHHHYAYALGRAVPARLDYLYLDLGHRRAASRLRRLLRTRHFDVFCLNDSPTVSGDDERSGKLLRSFLQRYFPLASSFELPPQREASAHRDARPGAAPVPMGAAAIGVVGADG